jgi:hypothetical protein
LPVVLSAGPISPSVTDAARAAPVSNKPSATAAQSVRSLVFVLKFVPCRTAPDSIGTRVPLALLAC